MSYSSFPPASEQGFLPEHTDSDGPWNTWRDVTWRVDSEYQAELKHFYDIMSDSCHLRVIDPSLQGSSWRQKPIHNLATQIVFETGLVRACVGWSL